MERIFFRSMLSNILWGLTGIAVAFALVKYRRQIINFTGTWGWAERYLGGGGTAIALVLFALVIFLLAVTKLIGKWDTLFSGGPMSKIF